MSQINISFSFPSPGTIYLKLSVAQTKVNNSGFNIQCRVCCVTWYVSFHVSVDNVYIICIQCSSGTTKCSWADGFMGMCSDVFLPFMATLLLLICFIAVQLEWDRKEKIFKSYTIIEKCSHLCNVMKRKYTKSVGLLYKVASSILTVSVSI